MNCYLYLSGQVLIERQGNLQSVKKILSYLHCPKQGM